MMQKAFLHQRENSQPREESSAFAALPLDKNCFGAGHPERLLHWQCACSCVALSPTRIYAQSSCLRRCVFLRATHCLKTIVPVCLLLVSVVSGLPQSATSSRLLAVEGRVEVAPAGSAVWTT